jgi:hypothetical protein
MDVCNVDKSVIQDLLDMSFLGISVAVLKGEVFPVRTMNALVRAEVGP